jgi:hypothetical protein
LNFVNADGVDLAERAVLQSPADDVFDRIEHLVPVNRPSEPVRGEFIRSCGNRCLVQPRDSASASDTRQNLSATQVRQDPAGGVVRKYSVLRRIKHLERWPLTC